MEHRFRKLYTTLELEEAHVLQALMRRHGIGCWLVRDNGLSVEENFPLAQLGYKLFIPDEQFPQGLRVFQETFLCSGEAPYTGSLDAAYGGKTGNVPQPQLTYDPLGPEVFLWNPPTGDPVGDAWQTQNPTCRRCGRAMAAGDAFCDNCGTPLKDADHTAMPTCPKCGHEMRADSTLCPTCGAMR